MISSEFAGEEVGLRMGVLWCKWPVTKHDHLTYKRMLVLHILKYNDQDLVMLYITKYKFKQLLSDHSNH